MTSNSPIYHLHYIAPYRVVVRGAWCRVYRDSLVLDGVVSLHPTVLETLEGMPRAIAESRAQTAAREAERQGV